MKLFLGALAIGAVVATTPIVAKPFAEMFPQYLTDFEAEDVKELSRLDYKQGNVKVGGIVSALATFDVPDGFYYLDPKDAGIVLTEMWGNPESETLGMIFPAETTPYHSGSWGLEITFDEIGYVSDEDAEGYDYAEILDVMKDDVAQESEWRLENNYGTIALIGWAAEPHYDKEKRQLYWAKELKFGDNENHTLNYNLRALGRKGVLVMNFISTMDELDQVEAATPDILNMVSFTEGNAYADFNPSLDKVAAVGIGGLIAGKVVAKTGLLVTALIFLKKFWFILLLPILALKNRFFGRKGGE
jgi:uncharacterized membrane-anchored protein